MTLLAFTPETRMYHSPCTHNYRYFIDTVYKCIILLTAKVANSLNYYPQVSNHWGSINYISRCYNLIKPRWYIQIQYINHTDDLDQYMLTMCEGHKRIKLSKLTHGWIIIAEVKRSNFRKSISLSDCGYLLHEIFPGIRRQQYFLDINPFHDQSFLIPICPYQV